MVTPETLHIVLWRGERIQIHRDGQLVYEGRSFAATLRELSSFFGVSLSARKHANAVGRIERFVRGFFGREIYIAPPFTPPPPEPLPEERLTSTADRARLKLARGIQITDEEVNALAASEQAAGEK